MLNQTSISGQEVLSADSVGIKVSVAVTLQVGRASSDEGLALLEEDPHNSIE